MKTSLAITPETKVADLLAAYPQLEDVLIAIAPVFAKLGNPVLRRTIARVTTLERAAAVAGLSPRDLVVKLRRAIGIEGEEAESGLSSSATETDSGRLPAWVDPDRVRWTLDADALLEAGDQPIAQAQRRAIALKAGDLGLVTSSFRPAPLVDYLEGKGYRTAITRSQSRFATYIGSPEETAC